MRRLALALTAMVSLTACGGAAASPSGVVSGSPTATPTAQPPSATPSASLITDGLDRFVADLRAAGAQTVVGDEYDGTPVAQRGITVCVNAEEVRVYLFPSPVESALAASRVDPTDPSHIGTSIVTWDGYPRFWGRDRMLVLYLGGDEPTAALITAILGDPFAVGRDQPQRLPGSC